MSATSTTLESELPMHTPTAERTSSPSSGLPAGFTLVELIVATVVLAVGLLALTSGGAATVRLEGRGQQLSNIASLGETRLELFRVQRCTAAPGDASSDDIDERWSVSSGPTRTRVLTDSVSRGAGRASSLAAYTFRSAVGC